MSVAKRCGASAKQGGVQSQGGVQLQRWGRNANRPQNAKVRSNRKGISARWGQNAKDASRKLRKPCMGVLFKLSMNLSIAIKNGSNEPKLVYGLNCFLVFRLTKTMS